MGLCASKGMRLSIDAKQLIEFSKEIDTGETTPSRPSADFELVCVCEFLCVCLCACMRAFVRAYYTGKYKTHILLLLFPWLFPSCSVADMTADLPSPHRPVRLSSALNPVLFKSRWHESFHLTFDRPLFLFPCISVLNTFHKHESSHSQYWRLH